MKERFSAQGFEPEPMPPEKFDEVFRADIVRWGQIIRNLGLKAD